MRGVLVFTWQPKEFDLECTTVWSFPRRGNWATHRSAYRGNWSPQVIRNLLLRYSTEGEIILDPMVGGGTTLIECRLTGRRSIGIDINPEAVRISREGVNFTTKTPLFRNLDEIETQVCVGDARDLPYIENASIDLVLVHPPYADIIKYSEGRISGDLSNIHSIDQFCDEIAKVALECFRVLKPGKYCAVLIGDTRRNKLYIPLAYKVMKRFLHTGFLLKEDIIKLQHNCRATGFGSKNQRITIFF